MNLVSEYRRLGKGEILWRHKNCSKEMLWIFLRAFCNKVRNPTHCWWWLQVGDDEFGYMLVEVLKENRVETRGCRFDPNARTALAFVTLRDDGEREFMFYRNPSADMLFEPRELDTDLLAQVFTECCSKFLVHCFATWLSPVLVWYCLLWYHWGKCNEDSHFWIPVGHGYLTVFLYLISFGPYAMQEPSYLGKIALVSICLDGNDPNTNSGIQTILVAMGRFFDTIIDVDCSTMHSLKSQTNTG